MESNSSEKNNYYLDVKEKIELEIIAGTYKSAEKIPSVNELSQIYDVSFSTAKRAVEALASEGILTRKQGVGFFVMPLVKTELLEKHKAKYDKEKRRLLEYAKKLGLFDDNFPN